MEEWQEDVIAKGWPPAHKHTQLLLATQCHLTTQTPDFLLHKGNSPQTQKSGICHAQNGCTPVQTRSLQKSSRDVPHAGGGCQLRGVTHRTPWGTPCPTALEQEVGVSNSSDLTQCHNIPQCSRLGQDLMPPLAQGHFFLLLNIQSKLKVEKHQA